jgi:hypothetical protein
MPKCTLQYVCGHEAEEDFPEKSIAKLREQAAEVPCPICWTAQQNQIASDLSWSLPPLEGTEKQAAGGEG